MPPKKTASAAPKAKQVNGDKATATKVPEKKPVKNATKATVKSTKASAAKAEAKPATIRNASKSTATTTSKKRRADDTEDDEPQVNGTAPKRAKKEPTPAAAKTTKTTTTTTTTKKAPVSTKRAPSTVDEETTEETTAPAVKKPKAQPKAKATKAKPPINKRPTQLLDLYLFGGGEAGELGFAGAKGTKEIKRPRLNPYLAADKAGVVQFSVGGMHTAALTHDNKILTWGVNDQGALGRSTAWDGGLTDMKEASGDDDSDSDSDDGEINPHESTPGEVDFSGLEQMPEFTQVVASDSATFALTDQGLVYGWGTFRSNEGIFGFSESTLIQERPVQVPGLKNIAKLAAGTNHILALEKDGSVFAWGAGQQNQLGRRILERHQMSSLTPAKFGLRGKFTNVGAGSFHSFAVKSTGDVYSWGLNSFGQTGCEVNTSDGGPDVHLPTKVTSLSPDNGNGTVIHVAGGSHHSIAVTDSGAALAFGRLDGYQVGIAISSLPNDALIRDANDKPRILTQPIQIPDLKAATAEAGSDHSIVVTQDGKAYSFGFNEYGQCGVGTTEDVTTAELIENTAVRGKKIVAAGCGGQFSCLGTVHETAKVNGVTNGA